jgi:hypothetical protein
MENQTYAAYINRKKIWLIIFGLILFALGCGYSVLRGPNPESLHTALREPYLFYPIMSAGALLFGAFAVLGLMKVGDRTPAVQVSPQHLNWSDIIKLEDYQDFTSSSLRGYKVILKDPQGFLDAHQAHPFHKRWKSTLETVGSPIVFYTSSLVFDKATFERLAGQYLRG